jgi:hypothetical protein
VWDPQSQESGSAAPPIPPEAGQLILENSVFLTELERGKERNQTLRRRMAESSVMLTHFSMRLGFLSEQVRLQHGFGYSAVLVWVTFCLVYGIQSLYD